MRTLSRHRGARGLTLVELMVSVSILSVVVAATMALFVAGSTMVRRGEEIAETSDHARLALETMVNKLQAAAMGAPAGIWVSIAGTPTLVNAIYGTNGFAAGTDDIWLVEPHVNALRQACVQPGASTRLVAAGLGPLQVNCVSSLTGFPLLMVTNMQSGAILSPPFTFTNPAGVNPAVINYTESGVAGFSNAPQKGGFQSGDIVFPVTVRHYFTRPNPTGIGRDLMHETGVVGAVAGGPPFVPAGDATVIAPGIEDLQVAWGLDTVGGVADPANIAFSTASFGFAFNPSLRSVRVSVVATSQRTILDTNGQVLRTADYAPMTVEGNTPPGAPDGRRRTLYSRRVELMNLNPVNL